MKKTQTKRMSVKTADILQRAFFEKTNTFVSFTDVREMRRIPSEGNSEMYAICLLKKGTEVMFVAKVCRHLDGSVKKVFVAEHPPIREFAEEYCKEQKKGK